MKKKDFEYEADASGYFIYYRHRCIGGRPIKGKVRTGKAGSQDKAENIRRAELDIHLLLEKRGDPKFTEMIKSIDDAYERWRKS